MTGQRTTFIQPEGSKSFSKRLTRVANRELKRRRGGRGCGCGRSLTLRDSLTSRLKDGLEGLPALCRAELEGVGKVMLACYTAEQSFLILRRGTLASFDSKGAKH